MSTAEKVKRIFCDTLGRDIKDDLLQKDEDKWDSFAHLDIITKLEEEFGVSFTPNEIGNMISLSDTISIVKKKIGEA